jgi:hypothetical protein
MLQGKLTNVVLKKSKGRQLWLPLNSAAQA